MLWRISIIILVPTIIFTLVIYRPIKLFLTGYYFPKDTSKTLLSKWNNKVGIIKD